LEDFDEFFALRLAIASDYISLCVYTYEVNKNLCLRGSGYLIADYSSRRGLPEVGDDVGDFALEYIDEYFVFRLKIRSALYKYMRMYLWTALRIEDFRET